MNRIWKALLCLGVAVGLAGAQTTAIYGGRVIINGFNNLGTISGTNTYAASPSPAFTAINANVMYCGLFTNANTGASTLNINSLGPLTIVKFGSGALASGDISASSSHCFVYNGTNLVILNIDNAPAGGTTTVSSGSSALGTGAIASGACATAVTGTATGALTTDALVTNFSADPTAVTGYTPSANGMLTIIPFITANTVNFKVCNNTSASITPGAVTLQWRVLR